MPNFIKRIEKFKENHLHGSEKVMNAIFLQPKGSFTEASSRAALGLIGVLISHLLSKRDKQESERKASELTKKLPTSPMIIGVTDAKRVLVYKQKLLGASIESFVVEYKTTDIVDIQIKSHFLMSTVILHFKDGGSIALEATMFQKLKEFSQLVIGR